MMKEKPEQVTVENINTPGKTNKVNARKYNAMEQAYLTILPDVAPGLTQAEAFTEVKTHLPDDIFPKGATAGWWVKTVQLNLEAKGVIIREQTKPLRWHKVK